MSVGQLDDDAIRYHEDPTPGKLQVVATKPLTTQYDLALAYSPGVSAACNAIAEDPLRAAQLTARGNLVAVITNGTAVLGLGAIGPLASKPVMEGKAVLFKKFANIDSFDIEIDTTDVDRFVDIVAALEPSFGAINLEDIKAPECFEIEERLRERMNIPVFHDDQHGTAICVGAACINGLHLVGKRIEEIRIVTSGAGAAALACLDLLVNLGAKLENITITDIKGVVYEGRTEAMNHYMARYATNTDKRTLAEVIKGADLFLGLSAGNVLKPDMLASMAADPIVLALANPTPEIMPELARETRDDVIIAPGRSDQPNQVNNVLCFPFIFRGALDVGAKAINEEMKLACAHAIAGLARSTTPETVTAAYGLERLAFGRDYLIPKPFDPRLMVELPAAVAEAAMKSGVAERPMENLRPYRQRLSQFVYRSGFVMKPLFERARAEQKRVIYTDGEEERVLRGVQVVVDEGLARPTLIGRPEVVAMRIERLGLRLEVETDFDLINPQSDPRFNDYVNLYHERMARRGVTPDGAKTMVRTNNTVIAALAVHRADADAMIAGPIGRFDAHLAHVCAVLGLREDMSDSSTVHALVLDRGPLFMTDTYVSLQPCAEEIAETTLRAARLVRQFGITPKVALLSHSNFGTHDSPTAICMREALSIIRDRAPDLEVDGEMHADAALSEKIRASIFPGSPLKGDANLLVLPDLDAANIAFNMLKAVTGAISVGPILIGPAKPAHIATPTVSARGIVNLTAVAAIEAQGWT
ncbi:MAG: NADP-dependent malic enzyme [Geminicoccaceae bacterium]